MIGTEIIDIQTSRLQQMSGSFQNIVNKDMTLTEKHDQDFYQENEDKKIVDAEIGNLCEVAKKPRRARNQRNTKSR